MGCAVLFVYSKGQPDDDPVRSKHVSVGIFYKVVLDGYLFIPYFVVQHNMKLNFKVLKFRLDLLMKCHHCLLSVILTISKDKSFRLSTSNFMFCRALCINWNVWLI
jgi:hypothetical protein